MLAPVEELCPRKSMRALVTFDLESVLNILRKCATMILEIQKGEYGAVYSAQWIGAKFTEIETHVVSHKLKAATTSFQLLESQIRPLNISRVEATGKYCLVMNYAEHKDLASYLRQNPNPSADFKIKILLSLTKSLKVLHNQNLIHRNIHCGNILLESQT
ncbi:15902_t:CDS:2, partial [Gigaspora margarita]